MLQKIDSLNYVICNLNLKRRKEKLGKQFYSSLIIDAFQKAFLIGKTIICNKKRKKMTYLN